MLRSATKDFESSPFWLPILFVSLRFPRFSLSRLISFLRVINRRRCHKWHGRRKSKYKNPRPYTAPPSFEFGCASRLFPGTPVQPETHVIPGRVSRPAEQLLPSWDKLKPPIDIRHPASWFREPRISLGPCVPPDHSACSLKASRRRSFSCDTSYP